MSKKSGSGGGEKKQFILQAVVLADAAELRFRPMTLEKPRCLLPLVNTPLIEYTLEFLAVAGVQEIFVFCNAHADQVRQYLASIKIHAILAPEAYSVGDVMRELDSKGLITNDFILVSGNVISNMKIDQVVQEHRQRREANKDALMTMVMKRASPKHRTRAKGEGALIVIDPTTSECIHYETCPISPPKRKISLDTSHFKKHAVLQVHNDLLDCQIDICSPEVPALFTENFDYQDIRTDFVRGILTSDLYGKIIHVHILGHEYAARVKSTQLYDSISRDIIQRWTFPMVPDSNIHSKDSYRYYRGHIYKEDDVALSMCDWFDVSGYCSTSVLDRNVVIGSGTEVGEKTVILNTTIGRNCTIGRNVVLEDAYIWDNVTIDDNSIVRRSVIADGAHIMQNVVVERGCLISFNVTVGPSVKLPAFTKITLIKLENITVDTYPLQIIGSEGKGYIWDKSWEEDYEEEEDEENIKSFQIGYSASHVDHDHFVYTDSEQEDSDYEEVDERKKHNVEIEETVRRAVLEDHTVENALLEVNALKMACNINFRDLPPLVIPVILSFVDMKNFTVSARKIFGKWTQMIRKFTVSDNDKMDCLTITLDYTKTIGEDGTRLFKAALEAYWNLDVVDDEDVFKQWFKATPWTSETAGLKKVVTDFIEKLDELETEEESTEDESE